MTAQKRRNGLNGRKRQRQQKQRQQSQSTSDEASSDDNSVTRCVCGEIHNVGLMVQCDKCEVWQHCECMGLAEEDIPEQYYCEECKPENHVIIKTSSGRTRRTYDANGKLSNPAVDKKAPKKRTTMNSQEASMSLEDILAARQALGLNGNNINTFLTNKSTPSSNQPPTLNTENHDNNNNENNNNSTVTGKRKRDDHINRSKSDNDENNDQATENSPTQATSNSDKDSNHCDNSKTFNTESEDTTESKPNSAPRATKVKRNGGGKSKIVVLDDNSSSNSIESKPTINNKSHEKKGKQSNSNHSGKRNNGNGNGRKTNHKSRSRTSTPQPNDTILQTNTASPSTHHNNQSSPTATNPTNSNNNNSNNNNTATTVTTTTNFGTSLLEHFSAESRATSPPAKVRYPTSRMSISEMNRRAKQILEYISSIQVDMANNTNVPTNNDDDFKKVTEFSRSTIIVHQQEYKTTSLITSASTSSSSTASTASSSSASASSTSTLENTQLNNKMELDHDHILSAGADTKQKKSKQQRPSSLVIPEQRFDDGPSSSLSSASTLPLDNSNPGTPKMDLDDDDDDDDDLHGSDRNHTNNNIDKNEKEKHDETSLEIMDMLTRELIKFQRKFGTGNYLHHRRTHSQSDDQQQQLQQPDEGRITRSASNTSSVQLAS
ncbi:hypothetical protein BJ944DRAFT_21426 [Cunninghamella echinulata]|nr:hypothetical protein BJ944DRAFT_21426 [Cunninghamella echinulata]